jgi:integrase
MLRIDLEAAGIPYVACGPDGPEYADFHALRHSYSTNVVNSGVNVKLAQSLARHSTVTLTLGRYTHVQLHDLGSAVQKLPALKRTGAGQPEAMRPTGTEGAATDPAKGSIKVP